MSDGRHPETLAETLAETSAETSASPQAGRRGERVNDRPPGVQPRFEPPRPIGEQHRIERSLEWVRWVGLSKLVAAAVSVVVIVAGLWWLLRAPPVPAEQGLPIANGVRPAATLTVASTAPTTSELGPPDSLIVQVAGNVAHPGVYEIGAGGRVIDAIDAAGGTTPDGDSEALNLAAPLADGARIYVPAVGEVDPASVATGIPAPPDDGADGDGATTGPVNINTAGAAELEQLPGIGPATAAAIVDDRQRNGPFSSVDELDRVPGIGPAKLEKLRDLVAT